jgi:hypothetical protein
MPEKIKSTHHAKIANTLKKYINDIENTTSASNNTNPLSKLDYSYKEVIGTSK